MKIPRLPKFPQFKKFKLPPLPRPKRKFEARLRATAAPTIDDYDDDEPQTKLSSAFIVVLLLHVVAVGGIYAFNSIKASRRASETPSSSSTSAAEKNNLAAPKPAGPEANNAVLTSTATAAPVTAMLPSSKQRTYAVKSGDTLTSIARQFAVNVSDLETTNGLKPAAMLRIGQTLNIPAKNSPVTAPDAAKTDAHLVAAAADSKPTAPTYTVKSGDRLLFIAKRFNVTPESLIALNKIKDPTKLQIGQTLKIPAKKGN